jgi:multidrug efflux pump subunit AcrB
MTKDRLNIAGKLASFFVVHKLTVLFVLGTVLIGLLAVTLTPREENPQIVVPAAEIRVLLPGASAAEVEELVIRPIEGELKEIPGVDHVYATAVNSMGAVMVQFKVGEDKEKSLVRLYDRILGHRDVLPDGAEIPLIRSMDIDDVPVVTVTLSSEQYDDCALKRLADRMIEGLRSQDSMSVAFVKGGRDREMRIELDPERMQAFGVTLDQVRGFITAGNISAPLGTQVQEGQSHKIVFDGFLTSEEDLNHLIVGGHGGRPIYLGNIARIVDGAPEERETASRFAYGPADTRFGKTDQAEVPSVTIAIAKKHGTNAVFFANDVLKRIDRMKTQFIPSTVDVVVTRNDGQKANDAVNRLLEHLGIAVISVFIITAIFLGWKEALVVGATVPLILSLTLSGIHLFGITINRVTLFAFIMLLGLVVDAAIVVIENIHRNYSYRAVATEEDKREITVQSTNEIGNPTNLATLAIMLVAFSLLPVLTGMGGQYFHPVGITGPLAMATSLLVAYCVVPWAANKWLEKPANRGKGGFDAWGRLSNSYRAAITPFLESAKLRRYLCVVVLALIALSLLQPLWQFIRPRGVSGPQSFFGVEVAFLPKDNTNTLNITIDMPEPTPLETTDRLAREIGQLLRGTPEVRNYQTWLGEAGVIDFNGMLRGSGNKIGPHVGEIRVNLSDKKTRNQTSIEIARELRRQIAPIAVKYQGSTVQVVEDPPGPPVRATVLAEIYGRDEKELRALSQHVKSAFQQTYDMAEVTDSEVDDIPKYGLVLDREKAAMLGISGAEAATALRRLIDGEEMGDAHISGEKNPVPIRLQIPRRFQIDPTLLSRITVTNRQGRQVALSGFVRVEPGWADRPILHKDWERVTFVGGEMGHSAPLNAVLDLNRRLDGMRLPDGTHISTGNLGPYKAEPDTIDGYGLLWDGEMRLMLDSYRDLVYALTLSITTLFLILVAYYESFSLPVVAMSAIPLGLVGIFPGHWLLHQGFSVTSLVGVLALSGIVIRNSLLIIDFVLDYRKQGMPLKEAILEAGAVRLRPILLTTMAIVFGTMVMLTDPVFCGLAISLIFGTVAATTLTLAVIPCLLFLLLNKGHEEPEEAGL